MICLEDKNATPDNSSPSLRDLNLQDREQASAQVSIVMAEYVAAMPEGPGGTTLSLTNIKFHSPSAILGTPSDPSSRFEYPFPSPQLEYEPHHSRSHTPHPPHSSSFFAVSHPSSSRQRQSHVHPKHDVREVPIPPSLGKKVNIELRFPRPMEGVNVLGQAHSSLKGRADVDSGLEKT